MLRAVAGHDPNDPTSSHDRVPDYSAALREDVKDLVVGVPRQYINNRRVQADPEVLALVDRALTDLESLGAKIEEVTIPGLEYATIANAVIYCNEYFNGRKNDLPRQLKMSSASRRARLYLGAVSTAADYVQAQRIRNKLKQEYAGVFRKVDVLASPAQFKPAPAIEGSDPLSSVYGSLAPDFNSPYNLVGLPAMSLPCGFNSDGLPVGLQLAGKPFDEITLFRAAYTYQQHAGWYEKRPPI
jgi:aspartyl-tRNA(Asn)/glutamyl-tRNA(Gln) amidotransferase subunit A